MSDKIKCPKCAHAFVVSEAVESSLRAKLSKEFEESLSTERATFIENEQALKAELAAKEAAIEAKAKALTAERTGIEAEVARRLATSKKTLEAAAKEAANVELAAARQEAEESAAKLRDAQTKEIELRKQQRALEAEKNELALKVTREIDAERSKIVEAARAKAAEEHAMKDLEWQKQRTDLTKQLDEMRRKAEQGSQQAQGEVLELEIEAVLKEAFPHDSVEPVAKGVRGGDVLLVVQTRTGARCGAILLELKRTKSWSDGWITKVKDDSREAKAEISLIVTAVMPKGVEGIGQQDGVWVCDFRSMLGAVLALRASILEVARVRNSQLGQKDKASEVYSYVNGAEFRGRVMTLVESFTEMKADLDAEKRALERTWAKREKQIVRAIGSAAGLYGDVQGIVGTSMAEIPMLTLEESIL